MTSTRALRNTSAQPGDRYGVTSCCLGNDHDISVAGSWRDVTLPLRKTKQTYPLQTCYEHNMQPLLHAVCLKVLDFFLPYIFACLEFVQLTFSITEASYPLFCIICWIVSFSACFLSVSRSYVLALFKKYRIAANFCSRG